MTRLGGEYRHPARDASRQQARAYLLQRLGAVAPEIVEKLREDVLPRYREAWAATEPEPQTLPPKSPLGAPVERRAPPAWILWSFMKGTWTLEPPDAPAAVRAMHAALIAWATRYRMTHDWILDGALRTLRVWHGREALGTARDDMTEPPGLLPPHFVHAEPEPPPFRFEHAGWAPTVQTRAAYEALLDAAYENAKRMYFAKPEAHARALRHIYQMHDPDTHAWTKAPELHATRRPDGTRGFPGFDWLIRYEFRGETQASIAAAEKRQPRRVRSAIHDTARLVGIQPRDGRGSGAAGGSRTYRGRVRRQRR